LDFSPLKKRLRALLGEGEFRAWFFRIGIVLAIPAGVFAAALAYAWLTLPPLESLERMEPSLITRMYDKDSNLLREFYVERRVWTPLERVPPRQVQAVLAIEDRDFWTHDGVNLSAIGSSLLSAVSGKRMRGASTLTQQLAKLVFLSPERSVTRKLREILLALRIERTYTKREILELYLNQVYLGAGAYGFGAAAERYFSRPLDSLDLARQATLAALLQRPEYLRPDTHPQRALARRNLVLRQMAVVAAIPKAQADSAAAGPLALRMQEFERLDGDADGYFLDAADREVDDRWGKGFLDSAGTRIRTTLDAKAQRIVETAMREHLADIQARMDAEDPKHKGERRAQGAFVLIENATGAVRALSGGLDWKESEFNRATMAARSPGSAFKPFVYAAAVDKGISPGGRVVDEPFSMPDPDDSTQQWRPHNLEYDWEGAMTWRRAFYRSRNIPAIRAALEVGLDTVAAYAHRFGLIRPMRPVPALALGACDVSPFEMAAALSVFPNGGLKVQPRFLESVLDRRGEPIPMAIPPPERVLGEASAWILCTMLRDVNIRGTAADVWAGGFYQPSGGKTGTSNDYCDSWYVGFTKRYTAAVWIGTDDHKPLGAGHAGTDDAMPLWADAMERLHQGQKVHAWEQDFPRPAGVADIALCKLTGKLAQAWCDSVAHDYRIAGVGPKWAACPREAHKPKPETEPASANSGARKTGGFLERLWKGIKRPF
jgi:penicillin-binding protein 1A